MGGDFEGHAIPATFFSGSGAFFLVLSPRHSLSLQIGHILCDAHVPEKNIRLVRTFGILLMVFTIFGILFGEFVPTGCYELRYSSTLVYLPSYLSVFYRIMTMGGLSMPVRYVTPSSTMSCFQPGLNHSHFRPPPNPLLHRKEGIGGCVDQRTPHDGCFFQQSFHQTLYISFSFVGFVAMLESSHRLPIDSSHMALSLALLVEYLL